MFWGSSDAPKILDAIRCGLLEEETSSVLPKRLLEPPPGGFNTLHCRMREETKKFVWNLQHLIYLMSPPHSPLYVMNNYSDLNLLQVILLCPWSIYFSRAVLIKYSQVQHKYCQPPIQSTWSLCYLQLLGIVVKVPPEQMAMLPAVFQKQQEIKRRPMTLVSILKRNSRESDCLLNCTYQLCICDTIQTHWLLIKADIS